MTSQVIVGIILAGIGVFLFSYGSDIAKGAEAFYRKLYTEKNLKVMFKIAGAILVCGGVGIAVGSLIG